MLTVNLDGSHKKKNGPAAKGGTNRVIECDNLLILLGRSYAKSYALRPRFKFKGIHYGGVNGQIPATDTLQF